MSAGGEVFVVGRIIISCCSGPTGFANRGFPVVFPGRTSAKYYFYAFIFKNNARQETLEHGF
jgi:hypothetical protein